MPVQRRGASLDHTEFVSADRGQREAELTGRVDRASVGAGQRGERARLSLGNKVRLVSRSHGVQPSELRGRGDVLVGVDGRVGRHLGRAGQLDKDVGRRSGRRSGRRGRRVHDRSDVPVQSRGASFDQTELVGACGVECEAELHAGNNQTAVLAGQGRERAVLSLRHPVGGIARRHRVPSREPGSREHVLCHGDELWRMRGLHKDLRWSGRRGLRGRGEHDRGHVRVQRGDPALFQAQIVGAECREREAEAAVCV